MTSPVKERAAAVLRPFLKSSDHGSLAALQSQALELIFCKSIMPIVCPEPKDRLEALIFLVKQDAESAGREFLRRLVSSWALDVFFPSDKVPLWEAVCDPRD